MLYVCFIYVVPLVLDGPTKQTIRNRFRLVSDNDTLCRSRPHAFLELFITLGIWRIGPRDCWSLGYWGKLTQTKRPEESRNSEVWMISIGVLEFKKNTEFSLTRVDLPSSLSLGTADREVNEKNGVIWWHMLNPIKQLKICPNWRTRHWCLKYMRLKSWFPPAMAMVLSWPWVVSLVSLEPLQEDVVRFFEILWESPEDGRGWRWLHVTYWWFSLRSESRTWGF